MKPLSCTHLAAMKPLALWNCFFDEILPGGVKMSEIFYKVTVINDSDSNKYFFIKFSSVWFNEFYWIQSPNGLKNILHEGDGR